MSQKRYMTLTPNAVWMYLPPGTTFLVNDDGTVRLCDRDEGCAFACTDPDGYVDAGVLAVAPPCVEALVDGMAVRMSSVPKADRKLFALAYSALPEHWGSTVNEPAGGLGWIRVSPDFVNRARKAGSRDWWFARCGSPSLAWAPNAPQPEPRPKDDAMPETKKQPLTLILAKTVDEARQLLDRLGAAGWKEHANSAWKIQANDPSRVPLLLLAHEPTKTFSWWTLGSMPSGYGAKFSPRTIDPFGLASIRIMGSAAAIEAFAKREEPRISDDWLRKNDACVEGRKWFADTFGRDALVARPVVAAALKAAGKSTWLVWLAAR